MLTAMLGDHNRESSCCNTYFQEIQGHYHRYAPIKINQISRLPEPQIQITSTTYPLSSFFYATTVCKVRCHSSQDQEGVTAAYGSYSADLGNMNAQYVNCVLVTAVP